MTTIVWSHQAEQDLRRLSRDVAERVIAAIERLALTGQGDVRRVTAMDDATWRLRVGEWRVIFRRGPGTIIVDNVLPRGRAYRD